MRTIVITGASRGIGKGIAEKLYQDGHRLSLGIRDMNSLKGSKLDPNFADSSRLLVNQYDAIDKTKAVTWIENTIQKYNKIDVVIHCAGIFKRTSLNFNDNEEKDIKDLWNINVMGPWILTKECWKYLLKNNNSRIITLVSMSGKRSKGKLAGYSATKFALMGLCQTIKNEGWDNGLRVTAICPSWVNTDMSRGLKGINRSELTQPNDIASIVSMLITLPNSCVPFEIALNCNNEL